MPKMNASQTAQKWAAEFAKSGDAYVKGTSAVTVNPAQQAIAAQDRMLANYTDSVNSGRWAAKMGKVTLQQYQTACAEKGKAAIANAARVGLAKYEAAEREIAPVRDGIISGLPGRGTIDENLERSRLFGLKMHEARKGNG